MEFEGSFRTSSSAQEGSTTEGITASCKPRSEPDYKSTRFRLCHHQSYLGRDLTRGGREGGRAGLKPIEILALILRLQT